MKKTISAISLCFLFLSFTGIRTDEVYICKGPQSKRYHYSKTCQGLKNCSSDIYKVKLEEAKELGRTLCGFED